MTYFTKLLSNGSERDKEGHSSGNTTLISCLYYTRLWYVITPIWFQKCWEIAIDFLLGFFFGLSSFPIYSEQIYSLCVHEGNIIAWPYNLSCIADVLYKTAKSRLRTWPGRSFKRKYDVDFFFIQPYMVCHESHPKLINSDQTGFIKGRHIGQNLRLLNYLMAYTEANHIPGIFRFIDLRRRLIPWNGHLLIKHWNFSISALWLGGGFHYCISIVESGVVNAGFMTNYFRVSRGVRQGCPLSPLLFVLAVEIFKPPKWDTMNFVEALIFLTTKNLKYLSL